jgi:hypothetical protein
VLLFSEKKGHTTSQSRHIMRTFFEIAICSQSVLPSHQNVARLLKLFYCSLSCSQIWLNPLVNDSQPHLPHKFEKEKKDWNLELGSVLCTELRWRCCCCFCVTYVRVARIRRDRPQTLVSTTSADIPLETTAFFKNYKLVDFTSSSSLSNHSSSAFWFDSSLRRCRFIHKRN